MPSFDDINLTDTQLRICKLTMSSDSLAAIVVDSIRKGIGLSVVRMGDGERGIIKAAQNTDATPDYLRSEDWLTKLGMLGADLSRVGPELIWAGNNATYFAPSNNGLFWPTFELYSYFPERQSYVDVGYPRMWEAQRRVGAVLRAGPSLVLHNTQELMCAGLRAKYPGIDINGMDLRSWKDHDHLFGMVATHHARTVLVSGGPAGKPFIVRLAQHTGKVVLDVGNAMHTIWANGPVVTKTIVSGPTEA